MIGPKTAYIRGIPIATVLPKQEANPKSAESSVLKFKNCLLIKNPVMNIKIPEAKNEMIRPIESILGNETCQKYIIKAKGKRMLKPVKSK